MWSLPDGQEVRFWLWPGFELVVTYHNAYLQLEKEKTTEAQQQSGEQEAGTE